ncbi:hypothetical protein DSCW_26110 [Desulfosarcina widdelii]|uniref:Mu-like prophage FluMu protein gp41 n=1 Tax=Desulfosarcina widdelii TaxID=947919 RepID=A0A5K7Z9P6_9BACT|nr:phage tail assembly protein [Desulfosarcina widdelii]BBO75194.1 hypothetical protein DSCW_26110 [Desulfosarcina widdelii]
MATISVPLKDGLKIGNAVHKDAELREYTAGDMIDACAAAEKVVATPAGPALVASPTMTDMELLCRQIVRIGDHKGPLALAEMRNLSGRDLAALQGAAEALDSGADQAADQRGRVAGSQETD